MDERKEYLIKIFIQKCISSQTSKEQLEFYFKWCANTYNVSEEKLKELREKFTIEEYTNRLIPVIDKHFSIEELKDMIKFYSTKHGQTLLEHNFLADIGQVGKDLERQLEQEFALNKNKP